MRQAGGKLNYRSILLVRALSSAPYVNDYA